MKRAVLVAMGMWVGVAPAAAAEVDFIDMSLEQLLSVKIYSVDRTEAHGFTLPAAVTVITRAEIEASAALTLTDLLAHVPGLYVREMNRDKVAMSSRNDTQLYLSNLLLLVDGQSLSPPSTNTPYWPAIELPLDLVERVEIIRGSGTPLWGSNAAGGVINVITRRADNADPGQAALAVGNDGLRRAFAELSGGRGLQHWRVQWQRSDDDGYDPAHPLQGRRSAASGYYDGEHGPWRWQAQWRSARLRNEETSGLTGLPQPFRSDTRNVLLQASYRADERQTLQLVASALRLSSYIGAVEVDTLDHVRELDFNYRYDAERWALLLGGNRREHDFNLVGYSFIAYRRRSIPLSYQSGYGMLQWTPSAAWRAELSLRDEHYSLSDDRELAYGARLAWQPRERQFFWFSVNRGFQQPNLQQLFDESLLGQSQPPPTLVVSYGNEALRAETVEDLQLGWRWRINDKHQVELSLFRDRALDQVYRDSSGPQFVPGTPNRLLLLFRNHVDSVSRGGELVWRGQWREHCNSNVSLSYFSETSTSQTGVTITAPSYAPRYKADVAADCRFGKHAFGAHLLRETGYVSENASGIFAPLASYRRQPAHWRLDLSWRYPLSHRFDLHMAALNLLNTRINWNYPFGYAPPTAVRPRYWLGLRAQW